MGERRNGHCLCGAVRFTTTTPLREVVACHCEECRRQSGHFVAATSVDDAGLELIGAENLTWYKASGFARRGFCTTCGSLLFWKHERETRTSIMAGAFDRSTGLKLEKHIWCAEKGDYYDLDDACARFEKGDDSMRVS